MNTYRYQIKTGQQSQLGTALFTALILLVAVTIVSLASLGTSLMELRMSGNAESTMQSFQSSQAALDDLIAREDVNFLLNGSVGDVKCTTNLSSGCTTSDIVLGAAPGQAFADPFSTNTHQVRIKRTSDEICPPRSRRSSSSCTKVKAANFDVTSTYDSTGTGFGSTSLSQGYIKLLPASNQAQPNVPGSATFN